MESRRLLAGFLFATGFWRFDFVGNSVREAFLVTMMAMLAMLARGQWQSPAAAAFVVVALAYLRELGTMTEGSVTRTVLSAVLTFVWLLALAIFLSPPAQSAAESAR